MRGMTRSLTVLAPEPSHNGETMLNAKLATYATHTFVVLRNTSAIGNDNTGAATPTHRRALTARARNRSDNQPPNVTPMNPPAAADKPRIAPALDKSTLCARSM